MSAILIENRLRQFLLGLAVLVYLATSVELILEKHTQEALQLVPFGLCALALVAVIAALARPARETLIGLRVAMVIVFLGGVAGGVIHILHNLEFEQEIRPNAAMMDTIMAAFTGASPLLAPGILAFGALIALIATYYHPALGKRK